MPAPDGLVRRGVGIESDHRIASQLGRPSRQRKRDLPVCIGDAARFDQVRLALPEQARHAAVRQRGRKGPPFVALHGRLQSGSDHAVAGHRSIERVTLRGHAGNIAVGRLGGGEAHCRLRRRTGGELLRDDLHLSGGDCDTGQRKGRGIPVGGRHNEVDVAAPERVVRGIDCQIGYHRIAAQDGLFVQRQAAVADLRRTSGIGARIVARRGGQVEGEAAGHDVQIRQRTARRDRRHVRSIERYGSKALTGHRPRSRQVEFDDRKGVAEAQGREGRIRRTDGRGDQKIRVAQMRRVARGALRLLRRKGEGNARSVGRTLRRIVGIIGVKRIGRSPVSQGKLAVEGSARRGFRSRKGHRGIHGREGPAALDIDADPVARRPLHVVAVGSQFGPRRGGRSLDPHGVHDKLRRGTPLGPVGRAGAQHPRTGRRQPPSIHSNPPGRNLRPRRPPPKPQIPVPRGLPALRGPAANRLRVP